MKQATVLSVTLVCVILLVSIISASNLPPPKYNKGPIKHFPIERDCAMIGGLCAHKSDCDEPASTNGLCPINKEYGAECCYRLRPSNRCHENLGECMQECNVRLRVPETECESAGQMCCILV